VSSFEISKILCSVVLESDREIKNYAGISYVLISKHCIVLNIFELNFFNWTEFSREIVGNTAGTVVCIVERSAFGAFGSEKPAFSFPSSALVNFVRFCEFPWTGVERETNI
jgi:hypothetical protein